MIDEDRFAASLRAATQVDALVSTLDPDRVVATSRRKRRTRLASVTAAAVVVLASGTAGLAGAWQADTPVVVATPEPSPTPGTVDGPGPIDAAWADRARAEGASDEQVAVLADGDLTTEEYESAVDRALTCIRDAGIGVNGPWFPQTPGFAFPVITYAYESTSQGRTAAETQAVADACLALHSEFVEAAYQTAPAVVEAQDARFEPYRADVIACVRAHDGEVADDAAGGAVLAAAGEVLTRTDVDCVREAGLPR